MIASVRRSVAIKRRWPLTVKGTVAIIAWSPVRRRVTAVGWRAHALWMQWPLWRRSGAIKRWAVKGRPIHVLGWSIHMRRSIHMWRSIHVRRGSIIRRPIDGRPIHVRRGPIIGRPICRRPVVGRPVIGRPVSRWPVIGRAMSRSPGWRWHAPVKGWPIGPIPWRESLAGR